MVYNILFVSFTLMNLSSAYSQGPVAKNINEINKRNMRFSRNKKISTFYRS